MLLYAVVVQYEKEAAIRAHKTIPVTAPKVGIPCTNNNDTSPVQKKAEKTNQIRIKLFKNPEQVYGSDKGRGKDATDSNGKCKAANAQKNGTAS